MTTATLLLLRHGIAEEPRPDLADAERALTERGRRRCRAVLDRLLAAGMGADRLLCSPLLRARQTARIAVEAGLAPDPEIVAELQPGGEPLAGLAAWLGATPEPRRLLLVGHEPDLSTLAARLIGAPAGSLSLRKAGLIQLRLSDPIAAAPAVLELLLRPAVLLA